MIQTRKDAVLLVVRRLQELIHGKAKTWALGDDRWAALVEAKRVLIGELTHLGMDYDDVDEALNG